MQPIFTPLGDGSILEDRENDKPGLRITAELLGDQLLPYINTDIIGIARFIETNSISSLWLYYIRRM